MRAPLPVLHIHIDTVTSRTRAHAVLLVNLSLWVLHCHAKQEGCCTDAWGPGRVEPSAMCILSAVLVQRACLCAVGARDLHNLLEMQAALCTPTLPALSLVRSGS